MTDPTYNAESFHDHHTRHRDARLVGHEPKGETMTDDPKCEPGCISYYGGEKKHHRDCPYYPESLTKLNADRIEALLAERDTLREERDEFAADFVEFSEAAIKTGAPDHDKSVLLAFKWSGGVEFCVAQRWYHDDHDDKVWVDTFDRDKVCEDNEVLGWWGLDTFEEQALRALAEQEVE